MAVQDSDESWAVHRDLLDTVPGTVLIEDPDQPRLFMSVEAETPFEALAFVEGVTKLVGIALTEGRVSPETDDYDTALFPEDDAESGIEQGSGNALNERLVARAEVWARSIPAIDGGRTLADA